MDRQVCFVIPVRHFENMRDPATQRRYLAETVRSIAQQTSTDWHLAIVANHGTDLPPLPDRAEVIPVDFPPNQAHERADLTFERHMDFFRYDKGRRVFAAFHRFSRCRHTMIVDDDDFVSRDLVAHVAARPPKAGYYFDFGYIWRTGGRWLYPTRNFHAKCGTSFVLASPVLGRLKDAFAADERGLCATLGDHNFLKVEVERLGEPLEPLPFPGAVYRWLHAGSHSAKASSLHRQVFVGGRFTLRRPDRILGHLARFRPVALAGRRFAIPSGPDDGAPSPG